MKNIFVILLVIAASYSANAQWVKLNSTNDMYAESEVIDYTIPSPYLGEIWDYSDPNNPKLLNRTEEENFASAQSISVVPNPTIDRAMVQLSGFAKVPVHYQLINSKGETIIDATTTNGVSIELNMVPYASGLYMLKIMQDDKVYTQKIIKL